MINWIKCSDRLPNLGQRVLGWSIIHTDCVVLEQTVVSHKYWRGCIQDTYGFDEITHWAQITIPSESLPLFPAIDHQAFDGRMDRIEQSFKDLVEQIHTRLTDYVVVDQRMKKIEAAVFWWKEFLKLWMK